MYNYCTLFDSNYLTRGLAMYESLKKNSSNFYLYIFAFDDICYQLLKRMNLEFVTVISLNEFEDEELLSIKSSRSRGEYCWTCTPSVIKYAIEKFNLGHCTYLDADIYFFSNPEILIEEMEDRSVLITEHLYTPEYDQSKTSGIYCVQFMTFKNDFRGMKVLNWWRNACIEWCYARFEDGKFGDQKYLDDWPTRFDGIHILQHLGGGLAPWNIQQYDVGNLDFEIIFYHFHGLKFLSNNKIDLGSYRLRKKDLSFFYKPYLLHLENINSRLIYLSDSNDFNGTVKIELNWKLPFRVLKRILKGVYNVYDKNYIVGL